MKEDLQVAWAGWAVITFIVTESGDAGMAGWEW